MVSRSNGAAVAPTADRQPDLLTSREAAAILRITNPTLERMRSHGTGPAFFKVGARVVYRRADIDAWLQSQRFEHTGQYPAK